MAWQQFIPLAISLISQYAKQRGTDANVESSLYSDELMSALRKLSGGAGELDSFGRRMEGRGRDFLGRGEDYAQQQLAGATEREVKARGMMDMGSASNARLRQQSLGDIMDLQQSSFNTAQREAAASGYGMGAAERNALLTSTRRAGLQEGARSFVDILGQGRTAGINLYGQGARLRQGAASTFNQAGGVAANMFGTGGKAFGDAQRSRGAAADIIGMINQAYASQMSQSGSNIGGMFGDMGTLLAGMFGGGGGSGGDGWTAGSAYDAGYNYEPGPV